MRPYEGGRPFWDRRTVPAGVVLAVVIGLLIWLLATRGVTHQGATRAQKPSARSAATHSAPTTPKTVKRTASSACEVPTGSQAVPQYTPQDITWQLYQTVALPYSKTAGPTVVNREVARCYAHDPLGALLAASQIGVRYLIAPDWRQVLRLQVVSGKGWEAYVRLRSENASTAADNQPGEYSQLAGFKFVTYSPAVAVIEMATQSDNGSLQAGPVTVVWSRGDWMLQLQPNGLETAQILPISSLVGFATWSGV